MRSRLHPPSHSHSHRHTSPAASAGPLVAFLLATSDLVAAQGQEGLSKIPLYLNNPKLDLNPARRVKNVAYYGAFELGTPPQKFLGCFDTGSADVWVPSVGCKDQSCETHSEFQSNASSTYQALNYNFQIVYATGSVKGYVSTETLTVGHPNITVRQQGFGLATSSTSDFLSTTCDGLFGLGFESLSQMKVTPPFFTMLDEDLLPQPEFSIWLNPDPMQLNAGEITLGGIDHSRYSGDLTFLPTSSSYYWGVELNGIAALSTALSIGATSAIIDSGSTAIMVSNEDADAIHAVLPNMTFEADTGMYMLTCGCKDSCINKLPDLEFMMAGKRFSLGPESYLVQVGTDTCASAILPGGSSTYIVLGGNFLRRYFTVFRWDPAAGAGSIGFADTTVARGSAAQANGSAISVVATRETRLSLRLDVHFDDGDGVVRRSSTKSIESNSRTGRRLLL